MKASKRLSLVCAAALFCTLAFLFPRKASALAPLAGTWSCDAGASCVFTVTTSYHASYQWDFGDGTASGVITAKTVWHTYNIPYTTTPQHFTVTLVGYTSAGTIDNIVGCTVTTYRTGVGGDPTTFSGNCN